MKWFTIAPEAYFFLLRRCVFFNEPRSAEHPRTAVSHCFRLASWRAHPNDALLFRRQDHRNCLGVDRLNNRVLPPSAPALGSIILGHRPICSSSHTAFMTRSRLIGGVAGHLLT